MGAAIKRALHHKQSLPAYGGQALIWLKSAGSFAED